jgi:hypothetical protein
MSSTVSNHLDSTQHGKLYAEPTICKCCCWLNHLFNKNKLSLPVDGVQDAEGAAPPVECPVVLGLFT